MWKSGYDTLHHFRYALLVFMKQCTAAATQKNEIVGESVWKDDQIMNNDVFRNYRSI